MWYVCKSDLCTLDTFLAQKNNLRALSGEFLHMIFCRLVRFVFVSLRGFLSTFKSQKVCFIVFLLLKKYFEFYHEHSWGYHFSLRKCCFIFPFTTMLASVSIDKKANLNVETKKQNTKSRIPSQFKVWLWIFKAEMWQLWTVKIRVCTRPVHKSLF